jgi:hypothetical protein
LLTPTALKVVMIGRESGDQLPQNREDSRRFGPTGVVGVHLGVSDRTILRDDITGGHRQSPTVLAVELRQVRTKRFLDLAQIVGQSPAHAELSGNADWSRIPSSWILRTPDGWREAILVDSAA